VYFLAAILQLEKETLMEMEFSEMKGFLKRLPRIDMDQILLQAFSIQNEVAANKLLD
jgi:hypothetical protein